MWRINKIVISNFKLFHNSFSLNVGGKNLLLYGENGSGKSSIYWSFYTFFQSCFKMPIADDAQKYFLSNKKENLRNKFSNDNESSGIVVEFINIDDGRKISYTDSDNLCNTHMNGDNFVLSTAYASDFLNYKYLSSIFDFKNSKEPELFQLFQEDVFPSLIINNDPQIIYINGTQANQLNTADYWWKYIKKSIKKLPRGVNHKYTLKTSQEFYNLDKLRKAFDEKIENFLILIETKTNQKLVNDFHIDAKIKIEYKKSQLNKLENSTEESGNLEILDPCIFISASINHIGINNSNSKVIHPRSFFNEAKLTCISIALRLSIAEEGYHPIEDDGVSALFIDDLLIGLDMSARLPVIDIMLKLSSKYQMFIFTHDSRFFHLVKERISAFGEKEHWSWREIYLIENDKTVEPEPLLLENERPFDKAKAYLKKCDYSAAANALRRQCEEELLRILPYNETHEIDSTQCHPTHKINLASMINKLNQMYTRLHIPYSTKKLNLYRELLLNPLSHYDVRTDIYRKEIVDVIQEIEKLIRIEVKIIVPYQNCNSSNLYKIEIQNDVQSEFIEFYFLSPLEKL